MPELPEVETVSRGLQRHALGRRILAVEVRHAGVIVGSPEQFAAEIEGRVIVSVQRKGKALASSSAPKTSRRVICWCASA